jgi:hypothetical protein
MLIDQRAGSTGDFAVNFQAGPAIAMTASPTSINANSTGNVITLTGYNTGWTAGTPGTPTFTLTGGTGASITAQTVASATSATVTISAGSTGGVLTIHDPLNSITTTINVVTLNTPYFAWQTSVFIGGASGWVNTFPNFGAGTTLQAPENIQVIPGNIPDVWYNGVASNKVCVTNDGSTPTAATAGTCDAPATTYTCSTPLVGCSTFTPDGTVTLKGISTAVGSANSPVFTSSVNIANFYPAPGLYAYNTIIVRGVNGGSVIYTLDTSAPTADGSCNATHGTKVANGATVTLPTPATTVVTAISCKGGTTAALVGSPATYITRAPITWYIDTTTNGGGTRWSSLVTTGQCNGQSTSHYVSGTNQPCPFNDIRYLWDDAGRGGGQGAWVIAGGDTVQVNGCTALANQQFPSDPNCRVGFDNNSNGNPPMNWCFGVGFYGCYNPPIPPGTASQPTLFLGKNASSLPPSGQTNPYNYRSSLTQIYGGFALQFVLNLQDTQYVSFRGIEITSHNGACSRAGSPSYPAGCSNNSPVSDFAGTGFLTNRNSAHITLQDVAIHGLTSGGIFGPHGAAFSLNRVFIGFNAGNGWQFDDGASTPNGPHATLPMSYVTIEGSGCLEEYPIVHGFPAKGCWDDLSGVYADSLAGQDTQIDSVTCLYCNMLYNTKDGFIGPHPSATTVDIENSTFIGNMGQDIKFITAIGGTAKVLNNEVIGNCSRFSDPSNPIPGAPQVYGLASGLGGAYLSDYCRAGGNAVASNVQSGATWTFAGNTWVSNNYGSYHWFISCGPAYKLNDGSCGTATINVTDNIFLGYYNSPGTSGPQVYGVGDSSIVFTPSHNDNFGNTGGGPPCSGSGNICTTPGLVGQPIQQAWTNQSFLDGFNIYPGVGSQCIHTGVAVSGMTTDYYGVTRPASPTIGAAEPSIVPTVPAPAMFMSVTVPLTLHPGACTLVPDPKNPSNLILQVAAPKASLGFNRSGLEYRGFQ